MQLENNLVDSFKISEQGKLYEFTLKDDIYFHRNVCFGDTLTRKLNAHDVKYSLERLVDKDIQSPGSWILDGKLDENGITVIDSLHFTISLLNPFPPFLGLLTMQYTSIVPREALEYYGSKFRINPVGTGPMQFKRLLEGEALYLVKNPDYFGGEVKIDGVKASYISDKKIAYLELLQNNIDYVSGLESSFATKLLNQEGKLNDDVVHKIEMHSTPYLNTEYIGINTSDTSSILANKHFRQALNYAIDRGQMLEILRRNIGQPANNGVVPPALLDDAPIGYSYDVEYAKQRIAQSNYQDEEITITTNKDYLDIITYVAKQWENIGINVTIDVLESSLLRQQMREGTVAMFRASWIADYPDPENFLSLFYSKYPAPPNYTRFSNDQFDRLYEQSLNTPDLTQRLDIYRKMEQILIEEAPVVFLFYDQTAIFTSKQFSGYQMNALNTLEVKDIRPVSN